MKVLQVTAVDFTLKKFLLPLVDALQREGYRVEVACHCGEMSGELKDRGYKIHHIPFARSFNMASHVANVWRLVKLIKKGKYDVLHAHTPVAGVIARLAAKLAGIRTIIYTAHGFYFHENMNPAVYKAAYYLEKIWGGLFTDYIFFQSREDYQLALSDQFKPSEKLLHIGNGVSASLFDPNLYNRAELRKEMGFNDQDTIIMFVGRLVQEKGIVELLEAYRMIKEGRSDVKLLLVGGSVEGDRGGLNITDLLTLMPTHVKNDVYLLGLRDDIPQLLSIADIFVLPSYREGLPRSIIEAMAMKKPIVATDIRGCREEVRHGYNGFLCRPYDIVDLADKISSLIACPEKTQEFGDNSRQIFLKEFDEEQVLNKQLQVFRQIGGG